MKITHPGIYLTVAPADYFADPCPAPSLTQSIAKVLLDQSELHARCEHPRLCQPTEDAEDEPEKYVKARVIGDAAHAILIGRGKDLAVGEFDNWKKKEAQAFKDEALAAGKTPILRKHLTVAERMVAEARRQIAEIAEAEHEPVLLQAFNQGRGEVCVVSQEGPLWRRALIDWMASTTLLFDYKTTAASASPLTIPKKMADDGWPIQAAMQERILDALNPDNAGRRRFFFIAHEQFEPFALSVHELPRATMTMGHKMLDRAEVMWTAALASGQWPGYPPRINRPEYPGWKESQWLDREMADEVIRTREPMNPEILAAG